MLTKKPPVLHIVVVLAFILLGKIVWSQNTEDTPIESSKRLSGFFFTSPLLECDYQPTYIPPFEHELSQYLKSAKDAGMFGEISIYFKQLDNGYDFGIDEHRKYRPASLLKVGNMIRIMKLSEADPSILDKMLPFKPDPKILDTESILVPGVEYSVWTYISEMIIRSDNQAMAMLHLEFHDRQLWRHVFTDLGFSVSTNASSLKLLSPKIYSSLFQVLYNGSYLNTTNSEKCLALLANAHFANGLLSGIPDTSIRVSHKFGFWKGDNEFELHETAIVYLRHTPYMLSVMSHGQSEENLAKVLQKISKIVYTNCSKANSNHKHREPASDTPGFTSHLVDCRPSMASRSIMQSVDSLVTEIEKSETIDHVSVYFRQLLDGKSFSINGSNQYNPASILEVAHAMAILKASENHPDLLNERFVLTREIADQNQDAETRLVVGGSYSLRELIGILLQTSDRNALDLVYKSSLNNLSLWSNMFKTLGLQHLWKDNRVVSNFTSEEVSLFYRVLFNSTYLSREHSEWVLKHLAEAKSKSGIRSAFGNLLYASLKRGIRSNSVTTAGRKINFVHEGGIVYFEDNPYILIVMTQGTASKDQANCISEISKLIYRELLKAGR